MTHDGPRITGAIITDRESPRNKMATMTHHAERLLIHFPSAISANAKHDGAAVAVELVNGRFVVTVYADACDGSLITASRAANV